MTTSKRVKYVYSFVGTSTALTYLAVLALVRLLTQTLRRAVDHQTDAVVHARVAGAWRGGDGVRRGGRGEWPLAAWTPPVGWTETRSTVTADVVGAVARWAGLR